MKKNKQVTGESPPTSVSSRLSSCLIHLCCFQDTRRRESTWVSPPLTFDPCRATGDGVVGVASAQQVEVSRDRSSLSKFCRYGVRLMASCLQRT